MMPPRHGIRCGSAETRPLTVYTSAVRTFATRCLTEGFEGYLNNPRNIDELERLLGGDREDSDASQH